MFRRGEVPGPVSGRHGTTGADPTGRRAGALDEGAPEAGAAPDQEAPDRGATAVLSRPNLSGDLDRLIEGDPGFRVVVRGYDRLQVDNYVTWAEAELTAGRREIDDLVSRYSACLAELETSRRLLSSSPAGREVARMSERIADMLRLAADEAAEVRAEADRILGEARAEAVATLLRARDREEAAAVVAEHTREEAATLLREAAAERDRLDAEAAAERDRLDAEAAAERARAAAASAARLAAEERRLREEHQAAEAARRAEVQAEIEELQRAQERARACCRELTAEVDRALDRLSAAVSDEIVAPPDGRHETPAARMSPIAS